MWRGRGFFLSGNPGSLASFIQWAPWGVDGEEAASPGMRMRSPRASVWLGIVWPAPVLQGKVSICFQDRCSRSLSLGRGDCELGASQPTQGQVFLRDLLGLGGAILLPVLPGPWLGPEADVGPHVSQERQRGSVRAPLGLCGREAAAASYLAL